MEETRARLLEAVADGPVTAGELATALDRSRDGISGTVDALREAGFEIQRQKGGYVLESSPEFGGLAVEFGLDAPYDVEYHDSVASTNERARELAAAGDGDVVVLADEQTGGRGRRDREWSSPSGGIWLSILVRPDLPTAHAPLYTLAAAVAVASAAREAGVEATIKWPNDVLVDGRKLCGILTEMSSEADRTSWIVVGIGINANVDGDALPSDRAVTTIREEVGDVDRRLFIQTLLEAFYDLTTDRESILPAWRRLSATLGQRVRIETPNGDVVGDAVDVTGPGTLVVETPTGQRTVSVGDCEHLRPD